MTNDELAGTDDWLPPHSHEPNPSSPTGDPSISIVDGENTFSLHPEDLGNHPQILVDNCYILSTGHGTSGPFTFGGVTLAGLLAHFHPGSWQAVHVISADNFQTRLYPAEVSAAADRPVLLALSVDGRPLSRDEGLVRLIVPQEKDDALRQVKWVREIRIIR